MGLPGGWGSPACAGRLACQRADALALVRCRPGSLAQPQTPRGSAALKTSGCRRPTVSIRPRPRWPVVRLRRRCPGWVCASSRAAVRAAVTQGGRRSGAARRRARRVLGGEHLRQGAATALAQCHHDPALAGLVPGPPPVDPVGGPVLRPDMAAEMRAVDLDHPALAADPQPLHAGRHCLTQLVGQHERRVVFARPDRGRGRACFCPSPRCRTPRRPAGPQRQLVPGEQGTRSDREVAAARLAAPPQLTCRPPAGIADRAAAIRAYGLAVRFGPAQPQEHVLHVGVAQAHDLGQAERAGRSRRQEALRHENRSREGETGTLHGSISRRVKARSRRWQQLHDAATLAVATCKRKPPLSPGCSKLLPKNTAPSALPAPIRRLQQSRQKRLGLGEHQADLRKRADHPRPAERRQLRRRHLTRARPCLQSHRPLHHACRPHG